MRLATMMAMVLLLTTGCSSGNMRMMNRRGDVKYVEAGLTTKDVVTRIGEPLYKINGEGVNIGVDEWVYPTGSVFVRRMVVDEVVDRERGAPLPKQKEEFDYKSLDPYRRDNDYFDNLWPEGEKKRR